ncbi:protein DPCD-like [Branchiostoma floridae]|uniref:Protein DPCD n=1 Tax=Branchiostoma floridae TaxID=7739 RepID=A0A9J7MNB6_BRAFL|nr:protein DPCD-like [Branchiostoma floridae]
MVTTAGSFSSPRVHWEFNMASYSEWLSYLQSAEKTALVQDGKKKVHFKFPDGKEMAEEYDVKTNDLLLRKWRKKGTLGGSGTWEIEVGDPQVVRPVAMETQGMVESSSNPIFTRRDTKKAFMWRIRNLPYPVETYNITVDADNRCIIIRTTNKKYYKKFPIPDMDRAGLPMEQRAVNYAHANNTLVITYEKPAGVLEMERQVMQELKKLKAAKDGDVECNPS